MGVPGFYSWLIKRYPLVKHMVDKYQLPAIDYLYLDMNGIIYKCVKDDSIIFKSQILPKELEDIWLEIFNYIDMIVNILKPNKMLIMALDGVAPRSKMNNQRARRFKSARDHTKFMEAYHGFTDNQQSQENFKNNSISPGTQFMEKLNKNLNFFIQKKIQEDDYWKKLSVIFTGSDVPGEGEHKLMEFIRANAKNFEPQDNHCLYGADADLIMLSMVLPIKNLCIIRQQYIPTPVDVKIIKSKEKKSIQFEILFITILREYFQIEYSDLKGNMKVEFDIDRIMADFVFLFFFIGNDFLPRCIAYNIRQASIQNLIGQFKNFLRETDDYVTGGKTINILSLTLLSHHISQFEGKFLQEKAEQLGKMAENKGQFETDLTKLMKAKAKNQQQFLLQLKTSYMNGSFEGKQRFYMSKFQISPVTQINQYYALLNYYMYGLQFVYEYYFTGLPSWQWYYPYYYAPLLSDMHYFLGNFIQAGYHIEQIPGSVPAQPFKQLMCILPKQSSDLLPNAFQYYLNDLESPLRNPSDFYPDNFQDDLYGSTRPHEAVSLIPFINLEILNQVYDKCITEVAQQDLRRNRFGSSMLYQYNDSGNEIQIQSDFQVIEKVRCTIQIVDVSLRQSFAWKSIKNISNHQNKYRRMPTLKMLNFIPIAPISFKQKSFVLQINNQFEQNQIKIGAEVFYGYPLQHSGKIQAILRIDQFTNTKNFDPVNYYLDVLSNQFSKIETIRKRTKQVFDWVKTDYVKRQRNSLQWSKTKELIFLRDAKSFIRHRDGNIKRIYESNRSTYVVIPSDLVSFNKTYETTRDNIIIQNATDQFVKGQDVLVFPRQDANKQRQGYNDRVPDPVKKGKVVGFTNDLKEVKVQIISSIKGFKSSILDPIINTNNIYYTLRFTAFLVNIKQDILLTLLDSIAINTESPDLPPSVDIGLNFISRKERKIVCNLVRLRIDPTKQGINIQKQFLNLEISQRGVELIIQYKEKFNNIFSFIVERHETLVQNRNQKGRINWKEQIKLASVFKHNDKAIALKSLMNVYIWLIKKEQTHMPLSTVYSKQVSQNKIEEMIQVFQKEENKNQSKKKYKQPKQITVNPNYLFSRRLAGLCHFNLAKSQSGKFPKPHTIRDQVICLRPQFFGDYGIVVGVDNNKFEVLFKKPRFGKTDLNGLSRKLYGGKFSQRQLFNMDIYPKHIAERKTVSNNQKKLYELDNMGFIGNEEQSIQKFKHQSVINSFHEIYDLRKTLGEVSKQSLIPDKFMKYIEKVKEQRKVEKLDPEYNVVGSKNKDYQYRYDKGQTHLQKSYKQKLVKEVKYRQKTVDEIVEQMGGLQADYETEVIESKITQPKKQQGPQVKKQQQKEEQEEDGDDILTG